MSKPKVSKQTLAILKKYAQGAKLDIGCGGSKEKDWIGIDILKFPGVDIIHDVETYPWPLPDNCIQIAKAVHMVEHINPAKFGFINFMNEIWRIMKPGGHLMIVTPYAGSAGYWWDPTHVNPCTEVTWEYFDPCGPRTNGGFYKFYEPKPWKIVPDSLTWNITGNMELALQKREFRKDGKYVG